MAGNQISVGGFISFSVENIVKHWLKLIGLTIIVVVAYLVCMGVTSWLLTSVNGVLGFLVGVVSVAVIATALFAFLKNILNLCRGEPVDFGAFVRVKPLVILNFAVAMVVVGAVVSFGMLLLVIPGIILASTLSLTPFLIIDRGLGPIRAIDESYSLTKDRLMDIFIVGFIASVILSLISVFIITLIITIPMTCLLWVYLYLRLTGQLHAAPKRAAAPPVEQPAAEQPAMAAEEEEAAIDTETRAVDAALIEAARGGGGQA
jgi:hypothetical protein